MMKLYYYIFGMDQTNPESCAADLNARGFHGVVVGSVTQEALEAADRHGLQVYLCYGAFSLGGDFSDPAHWARDADGTPKKWFSSGCPNDAALRDARLEQACAKARTPGVQGVFVDGARFASPASPEGFDAFWTCFCPRCIRKAGDMGMDADEMEKSVRAMIRFTQGNGGSLEQCLSGLSGWLAFRRRCIGEYFAEFKRAIKGVNPALAAGAFVFAPSLWSLAGQDCAAAAGLDIVAPMLYRRYPHKEGPACLNHEWAALLDAFTARSGLSFAQARAAAAALTDLPLEAQSAAGLLRYGFGPEALAHETAAARKALSPGTRLMPIIQLDDDRLGESVEAVRRGGGTGCGFFAWSQEHMGYLPELA